MLFYNDKGLPKGMALVGFQRDGDAALAANKYDGRFVDNSKLLCLSPSCRFTFVVLAVSERPLKVEVIVGKDAAAPSKKPPTKKETPSLSPQSMSLLERMNIAPVNGPAP
jgi:THO complex subunit 4